MFRFSVCPHDTAKNSTGWYFLNTFLQRELGCAIHFEPGENFLEERAKVLAGEYHLAYTDPFGAVVFQKSLGFLPIARPRDRFDETILVGLAAHLAEGDWRQRRPLRVASATDKLAVHGLGLGLLQDHHIAPADCEFQFVGTHLQAVKAVLSGNADVGFVFNETWHELSEAVRKSLTALGQTHQGRAHHCFCVAPAWADRAPQIQEILVGMANHERGQRVLAELSFPGFVTMGLEDLQPLAKILESFGAS